MSQTFTELQGNTTLIDSRSILNNNMDSLKTNFSGTTAPFAASAATLGATYYNTTDKQTYQVILSSGNYVWSSQPGFVHTTGNESVGGAKTFTDTITFNSTVTALTKTATTNTTDVATTAFVKLLVPVSKGGGTKLLYTDASGIITESTSTVGSTSQPVYLKDGEITAITGAIANNTTGNAATATSATEAAKAVILKTARSINGTSFDGSANITTSKWGTARNISIADATSNNTGTAVSVDGSGAATLKLPATIKADLTGTASKATADASGNTITTTYAKLASANTFSAANTFTGSVSLGSSATATTPSNSSNNTTVATTGFIGNKFLVINSSDYPSSPDADTFYFIKE